MSMVIDMGLDMASVHYTNSPAFGEGVSDPENCKCRREFGRGFHGGWEKLPACDALYALTCEKP